MPQRHYLIRNFITGQERKVTANTEDSAWKKVIWNRKDCKIKQWRERSGWGEKREALLKRGLMMHNQELKFVEKLIEETDD